MRWNDIMLEKRYNPLSAYKQSKYAQMLFACEFNRWFNKEGVRAYVVDPGLVNTGIGTKQTGGITKVFWELQRRRGTLPEAVAQTYVYLCESDPAGLYFRDKCECRYDKRVGSPEDGKRLFELSERLCGITFGEGDESK
jgi:NAD(P)-dependent dehydrogenase (short-subunit alcohol dehydrogenase family)